MAWRDYHKPAAEQARKLVMSGSSVLLNGFGGTSRTYATTLIVKELLEAKKNVCCTAFTHMASQNIAMPGAINGTLHHCLHRMPGFRGIAVIDEVSQIPLVLWAAILKWQLSGAKFILLGDFRSQFGPASDRWRQTDVNGTCKEKEKLRSQRITLQACFGKPLHEP